MPVVTAPMTGRTVGATTSFSVAPKTSGADGKPVLPVFARARKELKCKKCKHHTEWLNRGRLKIVEAQEKEPLGLGEPRRRRQDKDEAETKVRAWHRKNNLPWPGVRRRPLGTGKIIDIGDIQK